MNPTSLAAWTQLQPTLQPKEQEVYEYIKANRGVCNKEIKAALGWEINEVTPRVTALQKKNLVIYDGTKVLDGRAQSRWRVRV